MAMDDLEAKARAIVNRSYTDYERGDFGEGLVKYFAQALRDEREACARVVEDWQYNDAEDVDGLVAAIRQGRT